MAGSSKFFVAPATAFQVGFRTTNPSCGHLLSAAILWPIYQPFAAATAKENAGLVVRLFVEKVRFRLPEGYALAALVARVRASGFSPSKI